MNSIQLFVMAMAIAMVQVQAYPTGAGSCNYPSPTAMSPSQTGTGGFTLSVKSAGVAATSYVGGQVYTVTLSNAAIYAGFLIQAIPGTTNIPGAAAGTGVNVYGTFATPNATANLAQLKPCGLNSNAAGSVTHTQNRVNFQQASDSFTWTAPAAGTGTVQFQAVGVVTALNWFGQTNLITYTLTDSSVVATSSTAAGGVASSSTAAGGGSVPSSTGNSAVSTHANAHVLFTMLPIVLAIFGFHCYFM